MKKTVLRFGLFGIYTQLALFLISWLISNSRPENYKTQEVVSWVGILLSVIFVYFGMKYYRDKQNGGTLGFGEGMKLGLLIVLFPSIAFALYSVIHILWLDPQFLDKYYAYEVKQLKASVSATDLGQRLKEMEEQRQMFGSPLVQFVAMFLSVFVVGLIVTIISTLLLKRKAVQVSLAS